MTLPTTPPSPAASTSPLLLSVCTANRCRSPLMAALLGRELPAVVSTSAGTRAHPGEDCPRPMLDVADSLGVDLGPHRSRCVSVPDLAAADLVLTATRAHRRAVVSAAPATVRRAFTLREFARLARGVETSALRAAVDTHADHRARLSAAVILAAGQRSRHGVVPAPEDDVLDPYRRPRRTVRRSTQQIVEAQATVAEYLALALEP